MFPRLAGVSELGGVESLCLGLISGARAAPPWGSQTWGVGLRQARYSEELFKAAGSSPLLFTALGSGLCRVGAAIVTRPPAHTAAQCTHTETWGRVFLHLHILAGGPAAHKAGPIRQVWILESPSLPAHVPIHSPGASPKFRSLPPTLATSVTN